MKHIPLSQNKTALVDDADHESLVRFEWFALEVNGNWYAARKVKVEGRQATVYMHRQILGHSALPLIDHKDRNGLNNTRANLRFATRAQNMANTGKQRRNTTGFRGVTWIAKLGKWRAQIGFENRKIAAGCHASIVDAAKAYDAKARELFGEFAVLNFPMK